MYASSSGALCDAMQAGVSVDSFPGLTHIATYMASTNKQGSPMHG
jgi:hypothetical protein